MATAGHKGRDWSEAPTTKRGEQGVRAFSYKRMPYWTLLLLLAVVGSGAVVGQCRAEEVGGLAQALAGFTVDAHMGVARGELSVPGPGQQRRDVPPPHAGEVDGRLRDTRTPHARTPHAHDPEKEGFLVAVEEEAGEVEHAVALLTHDPLLPKQRPLAGEEDTLVDSMQLITSLSDQVPRAAMAYRNVLAFGMYLNNFRSDSIELALDGHRFPPAPYVRAKRAIRPGDLLVSIPRLFALDFQSVITYDEGLSSVGASVSMHPREAIVMYLLRERADDTSFWITYFEQAKNMRRWGRMPDSPLFWTEEELAELQSSVLTSLVPAEREKMINRFLELEENLFSWRRDVFPRHLFTPDLWVEWSMLVNSRAWEKKAESESLHGFSTDYFLVPFADFLRHAEEEYPPTTVFAWDLLAHHPEHEHLVPDPQDNSFLIIAQRSYSIGEEVTMDYGFHDFGGLDSQQLLINHGVVLEHNENTLVSIFWNIAFANPLTQRQLEPYLHLFPFVSPKSNIALVELRMNGVAVEFLQICRLVSIQWPEDITAVESEVVRKYFGQNVQKNRDFVHSQSAAWNVTGALEQDMNVDTSALQDSIVVSVSGDGLLATEQLFAACEKPISLKNELDAIQLAISIVEAHLESYGSSLEEDEEILESVSFHTAGMLTWRYEMALRVRVQEKRIHCKTLEMLRQLWREHLHSYAALEREDAVSWIRGPAVSDLPSVGDTPPVQRVQRTFVAALPDEADVPLIEWHDMA